MKTAKQVFNELLATIADNDHEGMLRLWDENCVVREAPDLPFGGDWSGRDGLTALAARQSESFQICAESHRPVQDRRIEGYHALSSTRSTSRVTGTQHTIPVLKMYTVRNGLITKAFPFYWNAGAPEQTLGFPNTRSIKTCPAARTQRLSPLRRDPPGLHDSQVSIIQSLVQWISGTIGRR